MLPKLTQKQGSRPKLKIKTRGSKSGVLKIWKPKLQFFKIEGLKMNLSQNKNIE